MLGAIVILRRSGLQQTGLALLLLFPVLTFISWQNWGNEQKWVWLLALLLVAIKARMPQPADGAERPTNDGRMALSVVIAMAMALSFGPVLIHPA